jgi:predicted CoA-binding protein
LEVSRWVTAGVNPVLSSPWHLPIRNIGVVDPFAIYVGRTGREVLESATTIAVVGASRDPIKAGGSVPEGLQRRGFRIIPINPFADLLFGERVYPSLAEVPVKVDVVEVFRPAADAADIARQAVAIGAGALWLQLGIVSDEARRIAEEARLDFVEDECMAVTAALYEITKPIRTGS